MLPARRWRRNSGLPAFSPQVAAESAGRESLPEGSAEPKFALPPIQRAKLANGMQVLLVEKHHLPVVNLNVVFPAGRANDGKETPGLADITAAVWDEGTTKRTAEDIAAELGDMGASFSCFADGTIRACGCFRSSGTCRRPWRSWSMSLRGPTFPERNSIASRSPFSAGSRRSAMSRRCWPRWPPGTILYGGDHPYGHPQWGNPAVIKAMKPEDLKRVLCNARFVQRTPPSLPSATSRWPSSTSVWSGAGRLEIGRARMRPHPDFAVPAQKPTTLLLIDKPHAAQSVIQSVLDRLLPQHARLLPAERDEHGLRRAVLQPLEPEPPRAEGLYLRRPQRVGLAGPREGPYVAVTSVQTAVTAPA